jgi:Mn-dependent DtxR family transcriptional regulator
MRQLKINWTELEAAFQMSSWEMHHYLDLETGDVLVVTDEAARHVEGPPDSELSEWMQEMVKVARQVEEGYGTRYIGIPEADSHEGYRDMEHFISTVRDDRLRDQLWRAIQGRGAFRRFKDVLADYPDERERWFAFKDRCIYEQIVDWLESEEIEPTNPVEPPEVSEPEEEEADEALLEDLTLLVIYLSSWEEELAADLTVRRAWKGYLFEVLNALEEKGYISQTRRAKSLTLTEAGTLRAEEIEERYTAS